MKCGYFETIAGELARGQMLEVSTRAQALSHAESCARCARVLAEQRSLAAGLRNLAQTMKDTRASSRVEAALLDSFRARQVAPSEPRVESVVSNVVTSPRWKTRWVVATAAAAVLVIALVVTLQLRQPRIGEPVQVTGIPEPASPADEAGEGQVAREQPDVNPYDLISGEPVQPNEGGRSRPREKKAAPKVNKEGQSSRKPAERENQEIATDFLPLTYDGTQGGPVRGHIVRVQLPRSAMAPFGIPVNPDRASEPVNADVVMGEDGLAHAIRFVR